jgi:hypothetical protein
MPSYDYQVFTFSIRRFVDTTFCHWSAHEHDRHPSGNILFLQERQQTDKKMTELNAKRLTRARIVSRIQIASSSSATL